MTEGSKKNRLASGKAAKIKKDFAARYISPTGDENPQAWKIRLENTINADPDARSTGLNVMRAYLEFWSPVNDPFLSMEYLKAMTGLDERTITKARSELVRLGYMVEEGRETSGVVRYTLHNPRAEFVLDHIVARIVEGREEGASKKKAARQKAATKENVPGKNEGDIGNNVPLKNAGDVPPNFSGDVPRKNAGEYLKDTVNNTIEGDPASKAGIADQIYSSIHMDSSYARDTSETVEPAPSNAPSVGATGASDASVDDDDWFQDRDYEEFGDDESVEDFLNEGVPDLPIRASAAGWRKMLAWVGENCGSSAMRDAAAHRRAGTLTIEMIEAVRRKNSNVA